MVPYIGATSAGGKLVFAFTSLAIQSYGEVDCVEIIPCLMFVLLYQVIFKIFGKVEVHLELPELEMEGLKVHFT